MADLRLFANTSNLVRFVLKHATTGQGLTGLTSASAGLIISTVADNEATATTYTQAGSTIEGITTLGTFATPTATRCRFKEVDATNHKGLYEFQFADARFAVASSKRLVISVTGATNLLDTDYEIQLVQFNPYDAVRLGLTALPNAAAEAAGGLFTRGTGAGQINQAANGMIDTNPVRLNNVSQSLLDLKDFADDGYDPSTNKVQGVVLTDTVTTYTGNTPQTGDSFARLGLPAGASVSADILAIDNFVDDLESRLGTPSNFGSGATIAANLVDIEAQTDDIGTAGAGLTAIPWNASWDAEVESEVTDALNAYDPPTRAELTTDTNSILSAISAVSGFIDTEITTITNRIGAFAGTGVNTILGFFQALMRKDTTTPTDLGGNYDDATDSLEAIRDRGDAAWTTATGFSTLTQADVRIAVGLASANLDTQLDALPTAAEIRAEMDSSSTQLAKLGTISNLGSGATIGANLVDIEGQTDDLESRLTATRAGYLDNLSAGAVALQASVDDLEGRLTSARAGYLDNLNVGGNVASAASITALNNLSATQVNAEMVDALNVDTYAEPGQEAPPATTTLVKKLGYVYKGFRNRYTQTSSEFKLYADNGTTVDQKATVSDDLTTFDRGEVGTGP